MVSSSVLTCLECGAGNAAGSSLCVHCYHPLLLAEYLASEMLFQDRYSIIAQLGVGGFAAVYKARDTQRADSLVAIKEICVRGFAPKEMMEAGEAFQREADLLAQLIHPGLPHLYEQVRRAEQWYLVMDFLEGETLEEYQNRVANKRLPLSEVFAIGIQLCDILEQLHMHQPPIVFRDLKPANIIRSPGGKISIIDFGIARFFKPGQSKDTIALGSPGYAAPEQYGRVQTTPRADIYSLGAVLHQLLTGKDPAEAPLRFVPLHKKRAAGDSDAGSLTSSMVEVLMESLGGLIDSMLEIDISKRPISIVLVKQELVRLEKIWAEIVRGYFRPRAPRIISKQ